MVCRASAHASLVAAIVLEELIKGLHELLRRPRLDDASVWQAVAQELAEAPGLLDYYTSGLLDY